MVIRFKDKDGVSHVTDAVYAEVEDISSSEVHDGKWVFKDEDNI